MATIDIKSIISFQKQFDTLTATLNIFDMSFLVSGAAMFGVCLYAFPNMKPFFIHSSHIFLSVLLCVLFAYIFGLICRIVGKRISDWLCMNAMRNSCKKNFSTTFSNMLKASSIESSTIRTMIDNGQEMMAYSYMWMKLDSCSDADCRNRFLYVSRIWVLRAIYEGLIVPVLLLAASICLKSCVSPKELLWKDLSDILNNHSGCIFIPIVVFLTCSFIYLLSKEADHCNYTQLREIISAYSDFIEKPKQKEPHQISYTTILI